MMAARHTRLLHQLRQLLPVHGDRAESDAELVASFKANRDEAAFAALVARHGPMVLGVCRRVLGDQHAVEDAFQATFMALARQVAAVRSPALLPGWLYGVAYRIALKARARAARRRASTLDAETGPLDRRPDPLEHLTVRELLDALEHEVQRLPRSYRLPVVLCCLEGLTQEEAAQRLGCSAGSIKGRLERGRKQLHARLVRRGATLAVALTAASVAHAAPKSSLLGATVKAALAFAVRGSTASTLASVEAVQLASGVACGASVLRRIVLPMLLFGLAFAALGVGMWMEPPNALVADEPVHEPRADAKDAVPRTDRLGDPLPPGVLFRIGTVRLQHGDDIRNIAASPDGALVASASNDGSLSIWETATGKERSRLPLDHPVDGWLAFTPDGKSLVTSREDKLDLLDVASGKIVRTFGGGARCGAFAVDGKTLTAVQQGEGWAPVVRKWDVQTGKPVKEWTIPLQPTVVEEEGGIGPRRPYSTSLQSWLSPDGSLVAIIETHLTDRKKPQTLWVFNVATGQEVRHWALNKLHAADVAFSPDGKVLAVGSDTATIAIWDVDTGKERLRWKADARTDIRYGLFGVRFTPDGQSLVSNAQNGLTRWDWRTGKALRVYPMPWGPGAFCRDGKAMVAQGWVNALHLLDTETGKDLCPLPRPDHHVAISADARLVVWPESGALVVADGRTGRERRRWQAHQGAVGAVAFAPGDKVLASAGTDKHVRLWEVATGREIGAMPHEWVSELRFSADGRRLASTGYDDVSLWDVTTGNRLGHWQGDRHVLHDRALDIVAIANREDKTLKLVQARTGQGLFTLPGYQERIGYHYTQPGVGSGSHGDFPPRFSPNGRVLLAGVANGTRDGLVAFWDVATGRRLSTVLHGEKVIFAALAFSPDSRHLALMRSDRMMCMISARTGELIRRFGEGPEPMTAPPAFTPDGRMAITAIKGLLQFWEVATGGEIARRHGHRGSVTELVAAADSRAVISVSWDNNMLAWDLTHLTTDTPGVAPTMELDAAWRDLANRDAAKGRRALEALLAAPSRAIELLRQRLSHVAPVDGRMVQQWIAELDSDDFERRQKATRELEAFGDRAGPALREALTHGPSLEARRRIESLLAKLDPMELAPDTLRIVRGVQALELIGNASARALLRTLADGAPGAPITDESKGSLRRLQDQIDRTPR
jgi:RNA polymerase sigma factor (sigma-70 family)